MKMSLWNKRVHRIQPGNKQQYISLVFYVGEVEMALADMYFRLSVHAESDPARPYSRETSGAISRVPESGDRP